MPGEPQLKVISQHEIKSVLPTSNRYQLPPFHQTFAGSVVFKGYPALDLLWILACCLAGLVMWKASGCSQLTPCCGESGIGLVGASQKAPFSPSTVRETCLKQTEISFNFGNDAFTECPGILHLISGKKTTGRQMMVHSQVLWGLSLRLEEVSQNDWDIWWKTIFGARYF